MEPDLSQAKGVRAQAKAARVAEIQRYEITKGLMSVPQGRAWVYNVLKDWCHCFRTSFTGDGLTMAFAEGERNIGLRLMADIMVACPEQYVAMIREANNNEWNTGRGNGNGSGRDVADPAPGPDNYNDDPDDDRDAEE